MDVQDDEIGEEEIATQDNADDSKIAEEEEEKQDIDVLEGGSDPQEASETFHQEGGEGGEDGGEGGQGGQGGQGGGRDCLDEGGGGIKRGRKSRRKF